MRFRRLLGEPCEEADVTAHESRKRRRRWPLLQRQGVLTLALVASAGTLFASMPVSQSFRVTVALVSPSESATVQCGTTVEPGTGRKINLACSGPPRRADPRYLLDLYREGEWLGTVDGHMGSGTVTSWRIVHAANREYLEMTVGW